MEKSGKRGKIPQTDWPLIMARYESGETLASIARTYDCSPPAISYIVSRNREQSAVEAATPAIAEPQLMKAPVNIAALPAAPANEPSVVPPSAAPLRRESAAEARLSGANPNGSDGEPRPKLHLSLGNGNGNGHAAAGSTPAAPRMPQSVAAGNQPRLPAAFDAGRNGHDGAAPRPAPIPTLQPPLDADRPRKDNVAFIDQELRTRVDGDIAAFLAAFDAALAEDTQASRFGLREATDRLLRAGARTRIELERLEARVPLPTRDAAAQPEQAAWRYR